MVNETEILNFIRQNIQMGIDGIKLVIDDVDNKDFYAELHREMNEYGEIYDEAEALIEEIGGEKQDVKAASKIAAHLSGRMKTFGGTTSKIADSMIQGSTMGVTKIIKHINEFNGSERVLKIAERLRDTLENNIEQLKNYL